MLMCRDLALIASDYIDGELGTREVMSVKMHLLMCGRCRSFIGSLRASIELMSAHSSQQLNEDLVRRIDERVRESLNTRNSGNNTPE
jgi:predicted anti-sigma-YlaC factor YlaD